MFRLIALALTSTFLLLALFGTSNEQLPAQHSMRAMGMMGALGSDFGAREQAAPPVERMRYVGRPHQPLRAGPEPGAMVLRVLPYGAPVELIEAGQGSFAQVRDPLGEIGFIVADSLSDEFPG